MKLFRFLFVLLSFSFTFLTLSLSAQENTPNLEALDTYLEQAMKDWRVPGMAVGIIKNDTVIMAKGYGVKNIEKGEKVDENTLFPIASNTKAFTSAAIAMLVDEGKIKWDDPVVNYLPYFKLYDPYVTCNMTISDLLCHRSGLVTFSGDLLWYGTTYSREEVVRRAQYLKPHYGFRTTYGYSNLMYVAAGEVVKAVTGKTWDEFVTERIIKPLGMTSSNLSITELEKQKNITTAHTEYKGEIITIPFLNWDNVGPAAAINSNVTDMLRWLNLQIHQGTLDGKEYFSKSACHNMWSPHTILPVSQRAEEVWPTTHFKAYGLGWSLRDYKGRKVIAHSGGYDGIITYSCFVPEENLGFVILTNSLSSLYYPLSYKILDAFLGGDQTDWSKMFLDFQQRRKAYEKKEKEEWVAARAKNTKPSLALEKYCGKYRSELYGEATIELDKEKLVLKLLPAPLMIGNLSHWHYDTFTIVLPNFPSLPEGTVTFTLDANGNIDQMRIEIKNPDFDFTELDFHKVQDEK